MLAYASHVSDRKTDAGLRPRDTSATTLLEELVSHAENDRAKKKPDHRRGVN